jgi:hypothetical protein
MKKFVLLAAVLILFSLQGNSQTERNQTLSHALELFNKSPKALSVELASRGYEFRKQQGNFYTYTKKNRISAYDFIFAVRDNKNTVLSWDEFIGQIDFVEAELTASNFKLFSSNTYGDRQIRGYQNLNRNALITLTTKGNFFTVAIGAKDPNRPVVFTDVSKVSNPPGNIEKVVDIFFSPKTNSSRIFAKPSLKVLHKDWVDSEIGLSWGFNAVKQVTTAEGTFYLGKVISSSGSAQLNGPYYILAEEWQPIGKY